MAAGQSDLGLVLDRQAGPQPGLEVSLFKASEYPAQVSQRATTDATGNPVRLSTNVGASQST